MIDSEEEVTMSAGLSTIEEFQKMIKGTPLSLLRLIVQYTSHCIIEMEKSNAIKSPPNPDEVDKMFMYVPNFVKTLGHTDLDVSTNLPYEDQIDLNKLTEELNSLGLDKISTANNKVQTQWILKQPELNNLKSKHMNEFNMISNLCDSINGFDGSTGNMNGCLVNYFPSGQARLSAHSDDESYVDQEATICTLSLGETRELKILEKKHGRDNKELKSFMLENQSLFIMKPGSQHCTKHIVMDIDGDKQSSRFSISFRHIIPSQRTNEWPHNQYHASRDSENSKSSIPTSKLEYKDTTLILGDSISRDLNATKLAGKNKNYNVINLSNGGAKIQTVNDTLDEFYSGIHAHFKDNDPVSCISVTKVILCVGTNDIRNARWGKVNHLFYPLVQLIDKLKRYYPKASIFIQSLLPQRLVNIQVKYNVQNFNRLLRDVSRRCSVYYLDMFSDFLNKYDMFPNSSLFRDNVHPNQQGNRVLARSYIKIIRNQHFDRWYYLGDI